MLIKRPPSWQLKESQLTDRSTYVNRRKIIKSLGLGGLGAGASMGMKLSMGGIGAGLSLFVSEAQAAANTNPKYTKESLGVPLTKEETAAKYNNFYEFGSHKSIADRAQALRLKPWQIAIEGEVEKPITIEADELISKMQIEERFYRFRCVEAWAMAVPWLGFPMSALLNFAKPTAGAKFVSFQTAAQKDTMPGLRQAWYPWPYLEAVTMEEAMNPLAFMATGIYGHSMPKQHGAPLRMVLPWKYGFKSGKSINKITFSSERPKTFWETIASNEYGFWANINPDIAHPRWSQATERDLDSGDRRDTLIFNGYGDEVASLYTDLPDLVSFR